MKDVWKYCFVHCSCDLLPQKKRKTKDNEKK